MELMGGSGWRIRRHFSGYGCRFVNDSIHGIRTFVHWKRTHKTGENESRPIHEPTFMPQAVPPDHVSVAVAKREVQRGHSHAPHVMYRMQLVKLGFLRNKQFP